MHTLLATNDTDDILLVQEPWFNPVGTARCDSAIHGRDILGGAAHPKWELHYPFFTPDQRAKVMVYSRIHDRDHPFRRNKLQVTARKDLAPHPSILIVDVRAGAQTWRLINFYNDIDDATALTTLLSLDLDPLIPTLLSGDFNLHSFTWSPPGWTPSPKAALLEEWAATNVLELLTTPGLPTHRGKNGARNSVIDLTWRNLLALELTVFQGAELDWAGSINSDHALIRTIATPSVHVPPAKTDRTNAFDTDLDAEEWVRWHEVFHEHVPPLRPLSTPAEVDACLDAIYSAFNAACTAVMKRKGTAPAHNSRWWTEDCSDAAQALADATTQAARNHAAKHLKHTVRLAKRNWADHYITSANVWEVAAWRHGRRQTRIPALRGPDGDLHFDHDTMTDLLADRFFAKDLGTVPLQFPDDPPPRPVRPFPPITKEETHALLTRTKNTSAPGSSGIGWELLKQGWSHIDDTLTAVFNACITLGYHPPTWKSAVVVVIPKPDKPDYTLPKAHRPISLLETMSKLLEKVIAQRFRHDIVEHELIPTTQFGGRRYSSCLDAGLSLLHDIQAAHGLGLKCGMLLFDVKGFFDHVNHDRLTAVISALGFHPSLGAWTRAFLADRKVRLRFNSLLADERDQPVGVPQGSPLSPVLSIVYTSALLHNMQGWPSSSLGMYVDDGLLFACGPTWDIVSTTLRSHYELCDNWLRRAGLSAEPDKTELIFFQKPYLRNPVPPPHSITLPSPQGPYDVTAATTVRYLGFFFHHRLKWEPHVRIMCNRARASIKALQVLGNTIRGLSMANWRLVMNAVCLPVLTYGCQLWYRPHGSKGLINMLQRVQNAMVKVVAGSFHTAPREALLQLTRMLPMRLHVEKLTLTSALRLYRLPRDSQLLQRLGPLWFAPHPGDPDPVVHRLPPTRTGRQRQPLTSLETLSSRIPVDGPRVHVTAVPPWVTPVWRPHLTLMGVTKPWLRRKWALELTDAVKGGLPTILCHCAAKVDHHAHDDGQTAWGLGATFSVAGSPLSLLGWGAGTHLTQFDADVAVLAQTAEALAIFYTHGVPCPTDIFIFSPSSSALQAITNPRSTTAHEHSMLFHQSLTTLTTNQPHVRYFLVWTPIDERLEGQRVARVLAKEACLYTPPDGLHKVQSAAFQKARARERAFQQWAQEWHFARAQNALQLRATGQPLDGAAFTYAICEAPSGGNHPLWDAAVEVEKDDLGRKTRKPKYSRRTTSTAFQLAVDHAFTGSYAARFRPADPPESQYCPCGALWRDPPHLTLLCPRFAFQRRNLGIATHRHTLSFKAFFSHKKHAHLLLRLITETSLATRPETGPPLYVPPEPD